MLLRCPGCRTTLRHGGVMELRSESTEGLEDRQADEVSGGGATEQRMPAVFAEARHALIARRAFRARARSGAARRARKALLARHADALERLHEALAAGDVRFAHPTTMRVGADRVVLAQRPLDRVATGVVLAKLK